MLNPIVLVIILYFVGVALLLALWWLPAMRQGAESALGRSTTSLAVGGRGVARRVIDAARVLPSMSPSIGAMLAPLHLLHRGWAIALSVLLAVPGTAFIVRQWHAYDGFDHTVSREANSQIAELLRGEQLVPPPKLPPELFATREVEQAHPLAVSASRQWELLDLEFRKRLLIVFKLMRERHGYEMVLIEGWRSAERQAQLASLGPAVTRAGAGQSYHQVGLAADCAFLRNGRIVISEQDSWAAQGYRLYGEAAQAVGLTWGGSWRNLVDLGHVELRRPGALTQASAQAAQRK